MKKAISLEQVAEISTLLLLIGELGPRGSSFKTIQRHYSSATWFDDICAKKIKIRDIRIDRFIENIFSRKNYHKSASSLKLIDYESDLLIPGERAEQFMRNLNELLIKSELGDPNKPQEVNIKNWVRHFKFK
ncbi:hypothetical protein [Sphingomonas sp. C3-2]|uniref:hypothetical protein n=1 Tax=Sphingomonas sp. C3-2 TaxID=3062169 RepID=UPI00294B44A8|nr:hypothetical protein [Sphingomonas sp. C3-2]WOK35358.1 hypothetical protein QYC26_09985 [Sphingomonas sp. C3-2]